MSRLLSRRAALKSLAAAAVWPAVGWSNAVRVTTKSDVIVMGGGLAGLHAASLLAGEGVNVTVLEAQNRLGGRLESFYDLPGAPEAGGDSILGGYGRVLATARNLGLTLVDHARWRGLSKPEIALKGEIIPRAAWPKHSSNLLPTESKEEFPGRRYFEKIVAANNPLANLDDWLSPESRSLDKSVYDFLRSQGWSDPTITQNYETNIGRGTSAHDCSILSWFFRVTWNAKQRQLGALAAKIEGGNQRLPEAMAAKLPGDVLLQRQVIGITQSKAGVEVLTDDGSRHLAKGVICALPLAPLRWLGFDPVLPPVLARATKVLPSMMITKTILQPEQNFWEDDGLDPAMWTDTPVGEVRALRQSTNSSEITGLVARARGFTAQRLDQLGETAARALVVKEYEKLRPAARGKLKATGYKSWSMDRFAGGSWTEWHPGQLHTFLPAFSKPFGNVRFCGEHTAISNRGMEAAMESAERAAIGALLQF
ncbi:MAG: flavin monoamine oxidase family protein [Lysobacterales bacterium]